uniref:Uncharacterized protein n=1 Tax=Oryza glumipatula TaxID=40148 RepID=A0A0E0A9G0_9ORYZ
MEPLAAAFPSGSPSCSRCFPLKLAGPAAAATAVRSQWLPSSSSHQASGDCRRLLASSMSTAAAISSPSPSHADLVLQDLCRIEHPQARGLELFLEAQTLSYHNINNVGPYFWWVLHAVIIIKAMKGSRLPAAWQLLFRISLPINCYCLCGICMLFITVYGMLFMKQRAGC